MIPLFTPLVPRWAWMVIAGLVLVAAVCASLIFYGAQREAAGKTAGKALVQAEWDAADRAARAAAAETLRLQNRANTGVTDGFRTRLQAAVASAARNRAAHDSLLDVVADLRAAASAPSAGPATHAAAEIGGLLGECSSRRQEVSADAGTLQAQVTGLQDYVANVCQPQE